MKRLVALVGLVSVCCVTGLFWAGVDASGQPVGSTQQAAGGARQAVSGSLVRDQGSGSGSSMTLTHKWADSEGTSRSGTVTVSQTKDLATRQVVNVSWSGFMPTVNATGAGSVHEAPQAAIASGYPVVLMECQGDDAATMSPEDCAFPNPNRFYYYAIYDKNETAQVRNSTIVDSRDFIETNGKRDHGLTGQYVPLPSDYDDSNVLGTTWYATWTNDDGTHDDARFEVRSVEETPQSLGCGDPTNRSKGACSIVVVPIRPLPCDPQSSCLPPNDYLGLSADFKEWQSASNWRNKFDFPIYFRPFPDVCKIDQRIPVPTQGSEMLNQAMLSWVPKFCTSKYLFKLAFTRLNDSAARHNLDYKIAGQWASNLAFTTEPATSIRGRPVVNAPVAVTGFTVAFELDSAGYEQVDHVNLDARLLAKLVTESYNAPPDPNVKENPEGLFQDPEFQKLNPGLVENLPPDIHIRNPVIVQGSPDLVYEVTRYIASDPEAVAWLNGKPDPWGMKVNPYYEGKKWPVPSATFDEQDPYTWKDDPRQCPPKPVMEQVSQYVYDIASVADAMIDRQPQDYSVCQVVGEGGNDYQWAHSARQLMGNRAMFAIMDIPSAEAYQFPMASLENHAGKFVAPTNESLKAALDVATRDKTTGTLSSNLQSKSATAYPGFMPVYAAAPTYGMSQTLADDYSNMITYMATSGQKYGFEAGELPPGYLALTPALRAQALSAAKHVKAQDCFGAIAGDDPCKPTPPTTPPTKSPTNPPPTHYPGGGSSGYSGSGTSSGNGSGSSPSGPTTPVSTTGPTKPGHTTEPAAFTTAQKSNLAAHLLPVLLVLGLVGLVAAPILVLAGRPGGGGLLVRVPWRKGKSAAKPQKP
jgi:hypothetical protein